VELFEDLFETQLWTRKHDAMTRLDITLFPMFINFFFRGLKLIRDVERMIVAYSFLSQPRPVLGLTTNLSRPSIGYSAQPHRPGKIHSIYIFSIIRD
jgi:hypothetical protein